MALDLSKLNLTPGPASGDYVSPFEAPIPGEGLTVAPKQFPYERPPEMTDPEEVLNKLFLGLSKRQSVFQLLSMLEAGVPISTLVEVICTHGAEEGKWSIPMSYLIAPPLTVMLYRMAQAAGITPQLTPNDGKQEELPQIMVKMARSAVSSGKVDAATKEAERSARDLPHEHLKVGIMSPKGFI